MRGVEVIGTAAICMMFWAVLSASQINCHKPVTQAPLTDTQIDALFQRTERGVSMPHTLRNFARNVERAHGIPPKGST